MTAKPSKKEPWIVDDCHIHPAGGRLVIFSDRCESDVIVQVPVEVRRDELLTDTDQANLHRIIACVNACEGIQDPTSALSDAIEALKASEACLRNLLEIYGEGEEDEWYETTEAVSKCKAALAKLTGTTND